ncbi:MAG: arginine repressor [Clostridia bacterium]|nr:arginine repressor [Clostridia bacterium]
MKNKRQAKILEIIRNHEVQTQDELQSRLIEAGFSVTQATVSRDIKELKLIKVARNDGRYRYTSTAQSSSGESAQRFSTLCVQTGLGADHAGNITVIRCMSGTANALCVCLDSTTEFDIVGTIAGDDTIFVLFREPREAREFCAHINDIINS